MASENIKNGGFLLPQREKRMKKILCLPGVLLVTALVLAGCANAAAPDNVPGATETAYPYNCTGVDFLENENCMDCDPSASFPAC